MYVRTRARRLETPKTLGKNGNLTKKKSLVRIEIVLKKQARLTDKIIDPMMGTIKERKLMKLKRYGSGVYQTEHWSIIKVKAGLWRVQDIRPHDVYGLRVVYGAEFKTLRECRDYIERNKHKAGYLAS